MSEQIGKVLAEDSYLGKSLSGECTGPYRWRTGQCRVISEIRKGGLIILALTIGHRKGVNQE